MRRYVVYLLIALLTFCVGSAVAQAYERYFVQSVLLARPTAEPEFKDLAVPLPPHTVITYSTIVYDYRLY